MMDKYRKQFGQWGEEQVALFFVREGGTVLAKNYHVRHAEIDLICLKDGVLYVIEVKTRRYYHHRIFRSVGKQKRKHIYLATRAWLAKHVEYAHYPIRFFLCMCIREPQQKIVFREFPCYVEDN